MNILKGPMLQLHAENLETGRRGEAWVAAKEQQKLANTLYANDVEICSVNQRSSFDIKSHTLSGEVLYIEVKTTDGESERPFYMSAEECVFAEHCLSHGIPYELHRVHHVNDEQLRDVDVYTAEEVVQLFDKAPVNYSLKKKETSAECFQTSCDYLPWEECAERIPGTLCRFYLAKIVGPHPDFIFERQFQRGKYEYQQDKIWLSCEIESTGVYEVGMSWKDEDGNVLQRHRDWFMLIDGKAYDWSTDQKSLC